jgi:hypothetical protein
MNTNVFSLLLILAIHNFCLLTEAKITPYPNQSIQGVKQTKLFKQTKNAKQEMK